MMNSNWFKFLMKATKVKYGKNIVLKGMPVIFTAMQETGVRSLDQEDPL